MDIQVNKIRTAKVKGSIKMKKSKLYSDVFEWLKSIQRFNNLNDYFVVDYKDNSLDVTFFTKECKYIIHTKPHNTGHYICQSCNNEITVSFVDCNIRNKVQCDKCNKKEAILIQKIGGYIGCIVSDRKPRAGEDWIRSSDLSDGDYCIETWYIILNDILCNEMVRISNNKKKNLIKTV